jgi:pimeloyl-ACP methyl ester carboxylesterase
VSDGSGLGAAARAFTPSHRGGSGTPLVCLHGFMDTWRIWELVLPRLAHGHDVLALTLAGHAGGPRSAPR